MAGYDSLVSTFDIQTWEVKGHSAAKLNGVSAKTDPIDSASLFRFRLQLLPTHTIALLQTPTQMEQYNFITYNLKSKFKFKAGIINYMHNIDTYSAMILRQHTKPDSSLSYVMWQPYPCLKAAMNPTTQKFECTECDPTETNVQLMDGKCQLIDCKTGYMYSELQQSCV